MKKIAYILLTFLVVFASCKNNNEAQKDTLPQKEQQKLPNIIFIYADDLGYGDVGAYGATEIQTPNMDRLAKKGVKFTNGYATSATCSPSRFALLTGIYPWRNKKAKILEGSAPLIIDTTQITLPKILKSKGYKTGIVGKWHLGLGDGDVDWNGRISPGPNEVGFDYSYIMAATQDRVPTVYIKNGFVEGLDPNDPIQVSYSKNFEGEPTGTDNPELLKMVGDPQHSNSINNGVPRIGYMKGGTSAKWIDEDMADTFLKEAQNYIVTQKNNPFFLYYALQQPHVPRTPHPRFVGTSGMGPRGDVIVEADWCIGELLKTLENENLLENTLIVFSSDNGPVLDDGYVDNANEKLGNHKPWGDLRGGKYSLFEAGTRVPFVTYWKGRIAPKTSDALVSQVDLLSSLSSLVDGEVPKTDSKNLLNTFLGETTQGRENLIIEATTRTALRAGDWILIPPYKGPAVNKIKNIETGNSKEYQLYNLKKDIGQKNNLAKHNPEKLEEMINTFESIRGKSYSDTEEPVFR
ncbi:arylsulfatase A-like enzyme [Jejuia pallidilutea]|jgi:arylsulfatase A-like enzyme|uniref:Arylsulfatase A-like enzyme n=1 Tax=Jejuia pallidilutea TaxID=504487 RepID=A0A362WZT5_9FLAO|nr:arylsulfatase [Jejuia pallidilutea]PQV48395.1 arylsulfatase A-like enzyme [Jejuia pallidilutea]